MARRLLWCFLLMLTVAIPASAQECSVIRGRAVLYRGDGFFAIWHVGTHHIFFPADKASFDLLCRYMDCESSDKQPALFANFTVCPTKPFIPGAAQPVIVKRVQKPRVVPDWHHPSRSRKPAR